MLTNNFYLYSIKILGEISRDILMFPLWWYTFGLVRTVRGLHEFLKNRERGLALHIWVKNLFRPMFGQTDWQGRLISIGMRLVQIFFRGIVMLVWAAVAVAALAAWLIIPPLVIFEIFFQIYG